VGSERFGPHRTRAQHRPSGRQLTLSRRARFPKIPAGIALPAGIAFALLAGLLLWRVLALESASRAEDAADGVLVAASMLSTDMVHLQSQERGFLLTGSSQAFGGDVAPGKPEARLTQLRMLVSSPAAVAQLREIAARYQRWKQQARLLIATRRRAAGTPAYSASLLQIERTHALNAAARRFLADRQADRARASAAVDLQVRVVVLSAFLGSLVAGSLLVLSAWKLLLVEAEQHRREESLREQNVRTSEAARVKSEFLAHMSHEFRTPLTAILGLGEMLYDEKAGPLLPKQKEYLDDILSSGRHLLGLINQVLDVAKIEAGKLAMHYAVCDPRAIARETVDTLRPIAQERQIKLRTDLLGSPESVVTDPGRLRQVLYNYLSNALAFTPAHGVVSLRIFESSGDRYRIEVSDTGNGIAPSDLPKLFREFSQVETGAGRARDGAGLGLVLTKRLVEAQGGTVGVESRLGVGSVFSAELPRDPRRAAGSAA
jgi:signal transduction histidine kinase